MTDTIEMSRRGQPKLLLIHLVLPGVKVKIQVARPTRPVSRCHGGDRTCYGRPEGAIPF